MSHAPGHTIEITDDDETKLAEIHRHPIGIILLYIQAAIGMIIAIGLAYFLLPVVFTDTDTAFYIANIFTGISIILAALIILIATFLYRQNRLILTNRNITQILQYGLFNRKVSQLNMHNVEDVTATQHGFLSTILNFGTLKIETAGEQVNFVFPYCPNAGYYASLILDCKEAVLGQMSDETVIERYDSSDRPVSSAVAATTTTTLPPTSHKSAAEAIKELGAETVKQATIPEK